MYKNGGKVKQAYKQGDNDFYWLNCPDKEHFFIIPEEYIINQISFSFNIKTTKKWYSEFLYKYSTIDQKKILSRFQ